MQNIELITALSMATIFVVGLSYVLIKDAIQKKKDKNKGKN